MGEGIYRKLKVGILDGTLQPGQLISANRLSKEMGVARSVVCESLARLKAEGLVRGEGAYSRTYVEERDLPAVVEHYEVREAVEGTAARLAAQNMNAWQVTELRRLANEIVEADRAGNSAKFVESNLAFHRYLVANCGNALLLKIYESHHLAPVALRKAQLTRGPDGANGNHDLSDTQRDERDDEFYRRLCDAIGARDGDEAERCLRDDLRQITSVLRSTAQSFVSNDGNAVLARSDHSDMEM